MSTLLLLTERNSYSRHGSFWFSTPISDPISSLFSWRGVCVVSDQGAIFLRQENRCEGLVRDHENERTFWSAISAEMTEID